MVNSSVELAMHNKEIAMIVKNNRDTMEKVLTDAVRDGQYLGQISKKNEMGFIFYYSKAIPI
jgi:TetR/AcrR family transcriptional repressor of nem operon